VGGGGGWGGSQPRKAHHKEADQVHLSAERRVNTFARKGIPNGLILSPHTLLAIKRLYSNLRQSLILAMFLKVET
jgi:hypothetical protein